MPIQYLKILQIIIIVPLAFFAVFGLFVGNFVFSYLNQSSLTPDNEQLTLYNYLIPLILSMGLILYFTKSIISSKRYKLNIIFAIIIIASAFWALPWQIRHLQWLIERKIHFTTEWIPIIIAILFTLGSILIQIINFQAKFIKNKIFTFVTLLFIFTSFIIPKSYSYQKSPTRPNVLISTDIGGSDPDDYQSLIHFLLYTDRFNIKGLISSPPYSSGKWHIEEVIRAYAKDYPNLKKHHNKFPSPKYLLNVTKQGAFLAQANSTPDSLSPGAQWMIQCARKSKKQPLYILVWGSITDVAQAVHAAPDIKKNIRIYSIGSWNTQQDPKARDYLYHNHADLWWIENNTTFRGMYIGGYQEDDFGNITFIEKHVKNFGALGALFYKMKKDIKMGDTPSVLYLLHGNPDDPEGKSWGGSFIKTDHGAHYWTDNPADSLQENNRAGAKTVNVFRKDYLNDWAQRMTWTVK